MQQHPFVGHRFFTVELLAGPPNEEVEFWVGVAFRRRIADPCEWAIDMTDRASVRVGRARTNDAGYTSSQFSISERSFRRLFDRGSESFRLRGAIEDHPRILIGQWRWAEGFRFNVGSVFTWDDLPQQLHPSDRVTTELVYAHSNPIVLFIGH